MIGCSCHYVLCLHLKLIKQTKSHIVIGARTRISTGSSCTTTSCRSCTYIADQITDIAPLNSFSKETWPKRFDINFGSSDDFGHFLSSDVNVIIVQNESTVYTGKFRN